MPRKEHVYHYIYKTTNLINGKYYIGMHSTSNLEDGYIGSGKRLRRSINKYGEENFKIEILEFLSDRKSLKNRENELVNEDILKDKMCMNIQPGGGGGLCNKKHRYKFFEAARIASVEKWKTKEWREMKTELAREQMIERHKQGIVRYPTFKNRKHSEETKEKMRKSKNIGKGNSQYGTSWITNGIENKKINKEDSIPKGWYKGRVTQNKN